MDFIHTNIKFLRKQKGWTQEQLAAELDIKRSLIGSYEEGRAKPNYEVLAEIAKIFKHTNDNLITRDLRLTERVPLFTDEQMDIAGKHLRVLALTVDKADNENIEMVPVTGCCRLSQWLCRSGFYQGAEPLPITISTRGYLSRL